MSEKQPTPPDWVNDVPARYGSDWPEERRCRYVFDEYWEHRDLWVHSRPCGYPTEDGQQRCIFHREGEKESRQVGAEMKLAIAAGAYLGESSLPGAYLPYFEFPGVELPYADLSGANLTLVNFSGAKLAYANLSRALLSNANLSGAVLSSANLTDALLLRAKMTPNTELDGIRWGLHDKRPFWQTALQIGEPRLSDERLTHRPGTELYACEYLYRQLKRWHQDSGDYEQAGTFFVREMECKRKQLPRWSLMRAVYHVLHFVSDYFESPWRVVVIGLLVILLFAFLHAGAGFVWATGKDVPTGGQDIGGTALTLNPLAADWATMGRALYFSAITFTATGYGDYVPAEGWGQFIAATESLIGVFLMAMFLVCLARKFGRA